MITVISITDFSGGLNTELESVKLPTNAYRKLVNGRINKNSIEPVAEDIEISPPAVGRLQGVYGIGENLISFVDGVAYRAELTSATSAVTWQGVSAWTNMSDDAERIYAYPVPASSNSLQFSGADAAIKELTFNGLMQITPEVIVVQDGVSQPQLISADFIARAAQTYEEWTVDNPEYIPIGTGMTLSGVKFYVLAPDGKKFYQSVSGRPLDFVINRTETDKGGNADTMSKSVSFARSTGLYPLSDGGLIVSTFGGCSRVALDYDNTLFAEPALNSQPLFPVGIVNDIAAVNIFGDVAFITPTGIQAFNNTAQTQTKSNNYPFSAAITGLFKDLYQEIVATADTNDFALFAMNTVDGHVVIVYDKIRQQFVGYDTPHGTVKQFAVITQPNFQRIFYINTDNELYEYSADRTQTRVVIFSPGDLAIDAKTQHSIVDVYAAFVTDESEIESSLRILGDGNEVGYFEASAVPEVRFSPTSRKLAWKTQLEFRFAGTARLTYLAVKLDTAISSDHNITAVGPVAITPLYLFTADIGSDETDTYNLDEATPTTVTPGEWYSVQGSFFSGGNTYKDTVFKARARVGTLIGAMLQVTHLKTMANEPTEAVIIGGDMAYGMGMGLDGSQVSHDAHLAAFLPRRRILAAGNHDLDNTAGLPIYRQNPGMNYRTGIQPGSIEFFIIDPGFNTAAAALTAGVPAGPGINPLGYSPTSDQANWLWSALADSEANFRIVVCHFPAITDAESYYPGYLPLDWDYFGRGATAVLNGHAHVYENFENRRFNCGLGGHSFVDFATNAPRSITRYSGAAGYLLLKPRRFSLELEFKTVDGVVRDRVTFNR